MTNSETTPGHHRRIWTSPWLIGAIVALVAAAIGSVLGLASSESDAVPVAAATSPTSSPSPVVDPDRAVCRAALAIEPGWQTAAASVAAGDDASRSTDIGISATGQDLVRVAVQVQNGELRDGDAAIALERAHLALAAACGERFGDGPW